MLEIIVAYCHELAHFFISYLNFQTNHRSGDRSSPPDDDNPEQMAEAGYSLERFVFGGYYVRATDTSGRGAKFMVCQNSPLVNIPQMGNLLTPFSSAL